MSYYVDNIGDFVDPLDYFNTVKIASLQQVLDLYREALKLALLLNTDHLSDAAKDGYVQIMTTDLLRKAKLNLAIANPDNEK